MTRTNIEGSSNLKSIGYDEQNQVVEVEFVNGRVYQYFDVSPTVYRIWWLTSDKGHYFNSIIRNYAYKEIT